MHRSVARILFWLHDHMPRAHNIHVMYNFEHLSSQVAAEWGVCVAIADVRHTVQNVCFSTSVQKLLTLLFNPFTETWLTIWPSKKYKSHTDINVKKFNPFCPLSLYTFWHWVVCVCIYIYVGGWVLWLDFLNNWLIVRFCVKLSVWCAVGSCLCLHMFSLLMFVN